MTETQEPAASRIDVAHIGDVAVVTLVNPLRRNSLSRQSWFELAHALTEVGDDQAVKAIVITGEGLAFCSGTDLKSRGPNHRPSDPVIHRSLVELQRCPKPTIAAVEGAAVAAGWSLALAADIVIAGDGAFFEVPFAARGMQPGAGILWFLSQRLGTQQIARMMWGNERYDAHRAFTAGLVNQVVPEGAARSTAIDLAQELAQLPPATLSISKTILRRRNEPLAIALNSDALDYGANSLVTETAVSARPTERSAGIDVDRIGSVGRMTVAAPSGGLSAADWAALTDALEALADDTTVDVIVVVPGNIEVGNVGAGGDADALTTFVGRSVLALYNCPKPTIAAVEGSCAADGWSLALACDLIIAADDARFETPSAAAGVLPGHGLAWLLSRRLDRHQITQLLWRTGGCSARDALADGLVSELVPRGETVNVAVEVAQSLVSVPELRSSKAALRRAVSSPYLETALGSPS